MQNFLSKSRVNCVIFAGGGLFQIIREAIKDISACATTLLLDSNKSLSNNQSDCSILSRDHKFI